jgi:hypothetical protein
VESSKETASALRIENSLVGWGKPFISSDTTQNGKVVGNCRGDKKKVAFPSYRLRDKGVGIRLSEGHSSKRITRLRMPHPYAQHRVG